METLAEGLDRHADTVADARTLRTLLSLHEDGHTGIDQSMKSTVQPILNEQFALTYPSQGLLTVTEQFVPNWTLEAFDPLDARPDDPPLRAIFREQFLNERVPYLAAEPGIRLHLGHGPLAEGPAADAADTEADSPSPDGWYPIRKRAGGQFPLEYIWAVTPEHPDDERPRLTPAVVEDWAIDADHDALYRQEISRFYYRTREQAAPLQRGDVEYLVERLSYALMRLIESIPYKDAYQPKVPVDATTLDAVDLPVERLPAAARDYLSMEHGAQREATLAQYRQSRRERARSGRSIPIRCTEYTHHDDGSLTVTGDLAYETLFDDDPTATQVASQARIRSSDGTSSGSWRVLTRLRPTDDPATPPDRPGKEPDGPSARGFTEAGIEKPETLKHSPPVLVEDIDQHAGTITLELFPHRFRHNGSQFRVDHCGWHCPAGSNLESPEMAADERSGYVAGRDPVWIDTDEVYLLDPMVDDFGAPKADRALRPETVTQNALWQQLRTIRQSGQQQATAVATPEAIEGFLDRLGDADGCLEPNTQQTTFIRAVDRGFVPLQGPPGTGKTSGATAPALLARASANGTENFVGVVVAPSHEAVDAVLGSVAALLEDWRAATGELSALDLVRVLPATPPGDQDRADTALSHVDIEYCNYHSTEGEARLRELASDVIDPQSSADDAPGQCLLFATPSTLYQTLGIVAETLPAMDGETAPAAMRHEGLADVLCLDEASMLDIPRLLLAGSVLKPTGQTLLVGDHRQLATVTDVDWTDTLRKPLTETKAYLSALEYVRWLNETVSQDGRPQPAGTANDDTRQLQLSGFENSSTTSDTGGEQQ